MNNTNRLGCLTGTGFVAALITFFVLVGVAFASGGQMFSSGALNDQPGEPLGGVDSHAHITECRTCHTAPWEPATMADRCLECHTNIAAQMQDVAQLHGSIVQKSPTIACRDCHHEHRGKTASLTDLGENTFPHEFFGFSLNEHQRMDSGEPITCENCHGDDITTFASDSCQTCHSNMDIAFAQAHLLSFGSDCLACHDGVDRFDDFNHNDYPFKLEGGHGGDISCTKCHLDARSLVDLQSAPQDCYSCHYQDDEHNGEFGTQCETCHTPSGWENATFDHDRFTSSTACVNCHAEPQEHLGQFGTDCAACHSTKAWEPASYNGPHSFPIRHGDGDGSCQTCHPNGLTTYTCYGCHEHTEANIASEHREEGISNFQNCIECHIDGREHEGGEGGDD
ncbi:MAG: cytochrome c3 family protein [Chloroflexi bacterium]|nr:cytochrome c3 family protein [Chloroflexota bacterium]